MSPVYKLLGVGAILAALVAGFLSYRDSERAFGAQTERNKWESKLLVQKRDAQKLLATEQEALADAKNKLAATIKSLETQRETFQAKNADDLRQYAANYRLRYRTQAGDGGGGGGGVVTKVTATGTTIDASATFVQLPEALNGRLFGIVGDAQSLLIDYRILYAYVNNPKLICEIREGLP